MKTPLILLSIVVISLISCELDNDPCSNRKTVTDITILGPNKTSASLSTGYVANKDCHADMTVTFYYTDPSKAMLPNRPPVNYGFYVGFGYFPHQETSALEYSVTAGRDIYVYRAHVNQGAKNESSNPVSFYIEANYTGGGDEVTFSTRIDYAIYEEKTEE